MPIEKLKINVQSDVSVLVAESQISTIDGLGIINLLSDINYAYSRHFLNIRSAPKVGIYADLDIGLAA
jgi:hypothetical protein